MNRRATNTVAALMLLLLVSTPSTAAGQQNVELPQQAVTISAVDQVKSLLVGLETIGGSEFVGDQPFRSQQSTGTVVNSKGMVATAAYNLAHEPTAIFATYGDGTRVPMSILARNTSRNVVLMKPAQEDESISRQFQATTFDFVDRSEVSTGQTAIAIGAFKTDGNVQTNLSMGIVSATNRIWGRAIQTDANVSATNYGGPLVDMKGRLVGLLVPLSNGGEKVTDGVQWYDSGIGFAVPFNELRLAEMAEGKDQYQGLHGIRFENKYGYRSLAAVVAVAEDSAASRAGVEKGDLVAKVNGSPISLATHAKHQLGPLYSGEEVILEIERDGQKLNRTLLLESKSPR